MIMSENKDKAKDKDIPNEPVGESSEETVEDNQQREGTPEVGEIVKEEHPEEIKENKELTVDPETLEKLTLGFLSHCVPDLQRAKGALTEILTSQKVLQETIKNENSKFNIDEYLEQTMAKTKLYHAKLLYIKKEMSSLSEKSFKLKKRGIKLQQQKIQEEIQKQEREEKEKLREEMLTAKIAKKRSSSQSDKS